MIGPRMNDVIYLVGVRPGMPKLFYARRVAPNGSLRYGYATVNRVIRQGLVKTEPGKGIATLLFPYDHAVPANQSVD